MFDWLGKGTSVDQLIARRQYARAAELIRAELMQSPKNVRLLQKLADVLILDRQTEKAVSIYHHLIDEFAAVGFFAKSIALAKKIQRVDPDNVVVGEQIAALARAREREASSAETFRERRLKTTGAGPQVAETAGDGVAAIEDEPPGIPDVPAEVGVDIDIDGDGAGDGTETFQGSPLFQGMSADEMLAVIGGLRLRTFEPGEIVVTEGEPGTSMFLMASGTIRVYVRDTGGANVEVRIIEQGDFFGEISLLTGSPRTATITAATPCELLELGQQDLRAIAGQQPQLPSIIEAFCTCRLDSTEEVEARSGSRRGGVEEC